LITLIHLVKCEDKLKFYRPKSISRLILIGYSLVTMPLVVGLVIATISVDRLVGQSQNALLQGVLATQGSQILVDSITAMERNARQYQVLGDKVLFDVYEEKHSSFVDTVRALNDLELVNVQRKLLEKLRIKEGEVHTILGDSSQDVRETKAALSRFAELAQMAQQILADNKGLINKGAEQIQRKAEEVQRTLLIQAIALVPAAVLLTIFFTILVTRPIKQIDQAIRRLGDGKFDEVAVVTGPHDLEQLGERLNWLRQRLLDLQQEKTKFLQHISHELKTPLTVIREGAELMNEQVVGDLNIQQREIAGILRDNSLQLQKLIEDLLNFSMLRTSSSSVFRKQVDLGKIIRAVLEDHKVTMLSRRLDLRASMQSVMLRGDKQKLRIMVDNLISNAIKYSPDGSPLWVLLFKRDAHAIIVVADAGPGIPVGERERVFEAFYQGASAAKGHVKGTGLGLSIAREYAQAHGGNITILDAGKMGTRFQIDLPLDQGS
jgi:two-component system sensor histidine kinase GlrK